MEHPAQDISSVIHTLTQGSPEEQRCAIETYFTSDVAFQHPFCRVPSFSDIQVPWAGKINSRWVIWMIYRWYKVLSPTIVLKVHSTVYDEQQQVIYSQISQVFSLWFVPFYKAHVNLLSVLHLSPSRNDLTGINKYYIKKQEDHYQFNEFVKFVFPLSNVVLGLWQISVAISCVVGALLFAPITWLEQTVAE
ncbi:hypothetical protein B0O80DRAFT_433659 [Mortierella sp. GBAus27b]|nr:hypothetical protein B0O80DRAFT_433659 [Mortierella sp. GBAus27b]